MLSHALIGWYLGNLQVCLGYLQACLQGSIGASTTGIIGLGATEQVPMHAVGDRDFGILVWYIEAQSSVVSGAGTVGGIRSRVPIGSMIR